MTNDIATLFPAMDHNELIYAEFIKSRIQRNGGLLKFQHITGQLSQLDHNVRVAIGASPKELMVFLRKYNDLFSVNDGIVSLKNASDNKEKSAVPKDIKVNEESDKEQVAQYPKVINDVPGIVIKVQPTFGFISIKKPLRTSVYFTPSCFNDASKSLLPDLGIAPGKKVCLNAKIGNPDFESKYRATKVWIPKNVENEVLHPEGFFPKNPKTRETGLYDADTSEGCGTIQKIFDTYGFISIEGDLNNTVFFHKNRVCNVENLHDLTKIFQLGDMVEYKAIRSKKQHMKVRWEATKVWIRKKSKIKSKGNVESATSDYESISGQSKDSKLQKFSDSLGQNLKMTRNKFDLESKEISNVTGKIYPSAKGIVIKFGEKDSKLADADSCLFYMHKVKVEDPSWEFSDGDAVKFDGIKIRSVPGFKAVLAWVGDKPAVVPITLGEFSEHYDEDSEYVSENEGCISETKRKNIYSSVSSLDSKGSKKFHDRSRSRGNETKSHSNHDREDSYSASSNSKSSQCSGFIGSGQRRSKSKNSRLKKNYKFDSVHSSHSQLSNCRSKASSRESVNSLSDLKDRFKPNPNLFKNWGDTPYPGEDNEESKIHLKAHSREGIQRKNNYFSENISSGKSSPCSGEEDIEIKNKTDNLAVDNFAIKTSFDADCEISDKCDQVTASFTSRYATEIFLSDEDFSDTLEEANESTSKDAGNDQNLEEDTPIQVDRSKSYIRRFQDLDGHVKKVFCKYAEIENENLRKPTTFFWNEMYHNGVPVPDKFDTLTEVVSQGHSIKFNCFVIVDDAGNYYVKVTVAWKGSRPKITEMTPEEYMIQNNIHVSRNEISISENLVESDGSESMRPLNSESAPPAAPRKFLTVANTSDNDSDEENVPQTPSEDLQAKTIKENLDSNLNTYEYADLRENLLASFENMEVPQLTAAISKMLINFRNSQMDSDIVASDLVNMILISKRAGINENSQENSTISTESRDKNQQSETVDSYAQTIITGKIFSESIFTL